MCILTHESLHHKDRTPNPPSSQNCLMITLDEFPLEPTPSAMPSLVHPLSVAPRPFREVSSIIPSSGKVPASDSRAPTMLGDWCLGASPGKFSEKQSSTDRVSRLQRKGLAARQISRDLDGSKF